ncbi:hypothetical protein BOTBODRAFT_181937 [Botryobasidium botryosum FD-172 SS1]|uniref:Uncharacterized protein n=1 Tax=Botryobasidium botryosum (strain FD-172 SS1) TaxID=930990 RepID=A0A067LUX8_BOTB1|nr:hypothetical protein BOTBODRAFT_181937 [Botryobasidium botryosum FD-172 SS1]
MITVIPHRWQDGIYTSPGLVKQFVTMPLGSGYTIKGQLTGGEDIGGLQFNIFKEFSTTVSFEQPGDKSRVPLNIYKTPCELGLQGGDSLIVIDRPNRCTMQKSDWLRAVCLTTLGTTMFLHL